MQVNFFLFSSQGTRVILCYHSFAIFFKVRYCFFYLSVSQRSNLDRIVPMQLHLKVGVFFLRSVGDNWHFQLF